MIVALATGHRRTHPGAHRCIHTINDCDGAKLFIDRTALAVGERVAVKRSRDPVVDGGTRQQISGKLFNREFVKRHI